jgi:uncharacterized protein (TIGR03435 family)
MIRRLFIAAVGMWTVMGVASAQEFEVASVRGTKDRSDESMVVNPGGIIYARVTLQNCVEAAYGVKPYQVSGPNWLDSDRFDISARAEGAHSKEELMMMLRALLASRFKLTLHKEKRELPVFALLPGRNGPKLRAADGEGDFSMGPAPSGIGFQRVSMTDFASLFLSRLPMIGRPVLDKTGLSGKYDFTLSLVDRTDGDAVAVKRAAAEEGFSLFVYALDQVGLRLEAEKAEIEMVLIDHAEQPAEN